LNPAAQTITANVLARFISSSIVPPGPPVSDDFNTATLNTNLWAFVNPVGNGSFSMTGSQLALTAPAGSNHDPAFGGANNAVRVAQTVSNADFTVELKFDSIPTLQYQFEGLIVEQDSANYLRFQFGSTGSSLIANTSTILAHNETGVIASTISLPGGTTSLWLRVRRSGNTWTQSWSADGSTFNTVGSFSQVLTVADLSPLVGNYNPTPSSAPAFTAKLDYFHNLSQTSPVSDNFDATGLNTTLWTFVDPVGNGSFSVNGGHLLLNVPGGSNHDPAFGGADNSVRIIQSIGNVDFTVVIKFDSIPSLQYQFQGLLVEQDSANYLRIGFGSTGTSLIVHASEILAHNETPVLASSIAGAGSSLWLRLQRAGSNWTVAWSTDGSTYNTLGSFTLALTLTDIGPFVGNYNPNASSAPAFTASVDYFLNPANPVTLP
jgi:regulation of enolase protein 1 (concanavalin A-like superfamily)